MPQNSREKRKDAPRQQRTGALSEAYKSASKALSNIPSSAKGVATGIVDAVTNPADSIGALSDAGLGLVSSGIRWATGRNLKPKRGETEATAASRRNRHEQSFGALKTGLVNRYGSASALKNTFETDPVGLALDVLPAAAGVAIKGVKLAPKAARVVKAVAKDAEGSVPRSAPKPGALNSAKLKATHYSFEPDLTVTDPTKWGSNKTPGFTPREERAQKGKAPDRTYFGLSDGPGVTKPYAKEHGTGPYEYEAELDPDKFRNMDLDRSDLADAIRALTEDRYGRISYNGRTMDSASITENLIKDQGYAGYRTNNSQLGDVAAAFEPVPVRRVQQPIEGAPTKLGPYDPLRHSAREYTERQGMEYSPPTSYKPIDEGNSTRLANAYDEMPHDPSDPDVAEAYGALKSETAAQLQDLQNRGYSFSFMDPEANPYPSPYDAIRDLRDNKRMQVYPTDAGFGGDEAFPNHPLLETIPDLTWDGKPVTYNDGFRAVHDAYGHAKEGFGFRAAGEDNAAFQHLPTFSPAAQRALLSETRGQNSLVNYGPNAEFNRTAGQGETIYAPQKAGLLPDSVAYAGTEDFMPDPRGTSYGFRGDAGGRGEARIRNDEGLKALLAERGTPYIPELPAKPIEAPAIIPERVQRQPDFGYEPSYSNLRNGPKRSDLDIDFEDAGSLRPRVSVSPEDLYGSTLIAGQADRTRAGGVLRGLNGKQFETPVDMEGGQDFMRETANDGSAWASMPGVMEGVLRTARQQEGPVVYTPFTMQGTSGDYSTMSSDAIAQAMAYSTKKSRREFDKVVREDFPEFPGFAGDITEAQDFMRRQPALRTAVAKALDTKTWRDGGLPNVEAIRHAITAPELADVRTEAFGYNMARIDPTGRVNRSPAKPHGTYAGHLPGEYLGGLDVQVPSNLMFPDLFDEVMSRPGAKRADVAYNLKRGVPMQKADQQWLDGIMPWYEQVKSTGDFDW